MTRYSIERRSGTWDVFDDEGEVASAGYLPTSDRWWIAADADRFPSLDSLPAAFSGQVVLFVNRLDDVFQVFGLGSQVHP